MEPIRRRDDENSIRAHAWLHLWRTVISVQRHFAQYALGPNGQPDPQYSGQQRLTLSIVDT
jgi:hypothetical protein